MAAFNGRTLMHGHQDNARNLNSEEFLTRPAMLDYTLVIQCFLLSLQVVDHTEGSFAPVPSVHFPVFQRGPASCRRVKILGSEEFLAHIRTEYTTY